MFSQFLTSYSQRIDLHSSYAKIHIGRGTLTHTHLEDNFGIKLLKDTPAFVIINEFSSIGRNVSFVFSSATRGKSMYLTSYPFAELLEEEKFTVDPGEGDQPYVKKRELLTIGSDVTIEDGVTIIGNLSIGDGAIIRENSTVTENVPAYAIVSGRPARVIEYRFSAEQIHYLLELSWWKWDFDFLIESNFFRLSADEFIQKYKYMMFETSIKPVADDHFSPEHIIRRNRYLQVPRPAPRPFDE